jgi:hypothetical protein
MPGARQRLVDFLTLKRKGPRSRGPALKTADYTQPWFLRKLVTTGTWNIWPW